VTVEDDRSDAQTLWEVLPGSRPAATLLLAFALTEAATRLADCPNLGRRRDLGRGARSLRRKAEIRLQRDKEKLMHIALWIVAGLMAAVFLVAGFNKLFIPREKLAKAPGGGWVWDFSAGFVKALGAVEILGAVGLILPALLDIAPVLVPLAALGLGLIMTGAVIVEFRRHEFKHVLLDLTYLALIAFVAWGRFGPEPFTG
jgi:uncharacterized membrane protein YphA (DoxX/SURF4 family)